MIAAVPKDKLPALTRDIRERLMDPTATVVEAEQSSDGSVRGVYKSCRFHDPYRQESKFVWFRDGTLVSEAARTM